MATSSIFASIMAHQSSLSMGTVLDTEAEADSATEAFDDEREDGEGAAHGVCPGSALSGGTGPGS
jgi:hypothetical protein